jgi:hypothetical protein
MLSAILPEVDTGVGADGGAGTKADGHRGWDGGGYGEEAVDGERGVDEPGDGGEPVH